MKIKLVKISAILIIIVLVLSGCSFAVVESDSIKIGWNTAALAETAENDAPIQFRSRDKGDDTRVRQLQERLAELDYLDDEADGRFGWFTMLALKDFQKDNGIKDSGILDSETETLLYSENARRKDIRLNSRDDETDTRVRRLQEQLIALNYLEAEADGVFGKTTETALEAFQKYHGLSETGILDSATEEMIYSEKALEKPLSLNDSDDEEDGRVHRLQERLIALNYLETEADGVFGKTTETALEAFQKYHGLSETGILDSATEEMIYSENAMEKPLSLNDSDDEGDGRVRRLQERLIALNYLETEADGVFGKTTEEALKAFQRTNNLSESGVLDIETEQLIYSENAIHKFLALNSRDWGEQTGVRQLQERLIDLDYLEDEADGVFGGTTEKALIHFQQVNGLSESGVLDVETENTIYSETAAPVPPPEPVPCGKGSSGYQVELIQEKMRLYGFSTDAVDGSYGEQTMAVVKTFQEYAVANYGAYFDAAQPENAVSLTSVMAMATLSPEDGNSKTEKSNPQENYAADGNVSLDLYYYLAENRFPVYRRDVASGDESEETLRLQNRLMVLEYYYQSPDGIYGDLTEEAVKYFQSRNGLEETGVADKATQKLLYSDEAIMAESAEFPYYVKVSIDDQKVYIYRWRDGGYNLLVRTMICSTGLGSSTPKGIFQSEGKRDGRWHYFTEFECWAQYAYRIKGNILFHSVIYSRANENSLRKSSVRNLGRKASHGCIRLMPEDAKFIYMNCPAGTTIEIY